MDICGQYKSNYGSNVKHHYKYKGFNFRMDELQLVVLRVKLKYLNAWKEERRRMAEFYLRNIDEYRDLGYKKGDFPVAGNIAITELSLQIWCDMIESEMEEVVQALNAF